MDLQTLWFVLIAVLWSGYFLLEGFDFGVGMLLPVLARNEGRAAQMFQTIGPVWDGNETWLVVAGGATFAAFPPGTRRSSRGSTSRSCSILLLPDHSRALVRVAHEGGEGALADVLDSGRTRSAASARR